MLFMSKRFDKLEEYVRAIASEYPREEQLLGAHIDYSFKEVGGHGDHRYEFSAEFVVFGKPLFHYKSYQSTGEEELTSEEQRDSINCSVHGLEAAFQRKYPHLPFSPDSQRQRISFVQPSVPQA